jgi:hypothetical protein
MNYLAHALPFLDDPYLAAGTAVPDWLTVADRAARLRPKYVEPWTTDADPEVAAVARGVLQHLRDDSWFHKTRAFAETNLELSALARQRLGHESGLAASFLGHLLVEMLLDATLIAEMPECLEAYYATLARVDLQRVEAAVNRFATQPTQRLAVFAGHFSAARILSDYTEDAKLMVRVDQVMRRVGLEPLGDGLADVLPYARRLVARRRHELLEGIPVTEKTPCVTD